MHLKIRPGRLALGACAGVVALAAHADHAAEPVNYMALHIGRNDVSDWTGTVSLGPAVALPGTVSATRGTHFGLAGGRHWAHSRLELEYQGGGFDIWGISLGPVTQGLSASGDYNALTFNGYATQPVGERFTVYGALGIGWGRVSLPQMGFSGGCNCFPSASKSGFAWLARAGAEYSFDRDNKAFVQYTHLELPRPASAGAAPGVQYDRKAVGALSIGYRRVF